MNKMDVITGITAYITGKHDYQMGTFGHIGKIREDQVVLHVHVTKNASVTAKVFTIDGDRNIAFATSHDGDHQRLVQIMIKRDGERLRYTDSKVNYLMVANFGQNGFVTVNVVCLIAQGGEFFLVRQQTHQVQAFRDGINVVCPELNRKFAGWKQLGDYVAERYKKNTLPAIEKFAAMRWDTSQLADGEVIVTVWSARRQSGGGVNNKNEGVAIYWADIDPPAEIAPKVVTIGEIVRYRKLEKPKRQTDFVWEGRGITRTGEIADRVADVTDVYADPSKAQKQEPVSA